MQSCQHRIFFTLEKEDPQPSNRLHTTEPIKMKASIFLMVASASLALAHPASLVEHASSACPNKLYSVPSCCSPNLLKLGCSNRKRIPPASCSPATRHLLRFDSCWRISNQQLLEQKTGPTWKKSAMTRSLFAAAHLLPLLVVFVSNPPASRKTTNQVGPSVDGCVTFWRMSSV